MTGTTTQCAPAAAPKQASRVYVPRIDIAETADELLLFADLPGVQPADVSLDFHDGELTLHAAVKPRTPGGKQVHREYAVGDFRRTFRVTEQIDADKITATAADGVLTVTLPKAAAAKPRKIAVA